MINYKGVSPCDSNNKWAFLCCPCLCLWGTPDPRAPFKNNIKANKGQWKYELQTASDSGMQDARCKRPESAGKIGKCGKTKKSDENLGDSWVVVVFFFVFVFFLFLLLLSLLGRRSPSLAWSMDQLVSSPSLVSGSVSSAVFIWGLSGWQATPRLTFDSRHCPGNLRGWSQGATFSWRWQRAIYSGWIINIIFIS